MGLENFVGRMIREMLERFNMVNCHSFKDMDPTCYSTSGYASHSGSIVVPMSIMYGEHFEVKTFVWTKGGKALQCAQNRQIVGHVP
eukprot:10036396-Karenia_brevis.AAC.1